MNNAINFINNYRIWIISFILSFALHLALITFMLYEAKNKAMDDSGLSGEISDSFQSIMMVSNLPTEEFKEIAINQKKAMVNPVQEKVEKIEKKEKATKDSTITDALEANSELKSAKDISQNIESKSQAQESKAVSADSAAEMDSVTKEQTASTPRQDSQQQVTTKAVGSKSSDVANYQSILAAHLSKFKKYPNEALVSEQEGIIIVRVSMDENGNVLSRAIKKGCPYDVLNSETLALFERASPLPAPPSDLIKNGKVTLSLPIRYNLKEYYASMRK